MEVCSIYSFACMFLYDVFMECPWLALDWSISSTTWPHPQLLFSSF